MWWRYHITGDEDGILNPFTMVTMSRTIGHMMTFNHGNKSAIAYLERFELFVAANSMDNHRVVPMLLTVIGPFYYFLLRGLVIPKQPKFLSFEEPKETLKNQFDLKPFLIAERSYSYTLRVRVNSEIS